MLAKVKVLEPAEFESWQAAWKPLEAQKPKAGVSLLDLGQELFTKKGCNACHAVTDQKLIGPGMKGIFGRTSELTDGTKTTVDENYIRESLMDPQVKLVKGYPPVMPTFRGTLTDDEVNALVVYLKSLK
jgi:cytochrome c oxidase subunit 2